MPETSRQMKVSDINVCISACVCTPFIVRSLKLESEDIILESDAWFYSRNKHLLQHGTKKLTMADFSFISTGQSVKCFYNPTVYILLKLEVVYYKLSEVQTRLTFGFWRLFGPRTCFLYHRGQNRGLHLQNEHYVVITKICNQWLSS